MNHENRKAMFAKQQRIKSLDPIGGIGQGKRCFLCGSKSDSRLCKKCASDKAVQARNIRRFTGKSIKGITGEKFN